MAGPFQRSLQLPSALAEASLRGDDIYMAFVLRGLEDVARAEIISVLGLVSSEVVTVGNVDKICGGDAGVMKVVFPLNPAVPLSELRRLRMVQAFFAFVGSISRVPIESAAALDLVHRALLEAPHWPRALQLWRKHFRESPPAGSGLPLTFRASSIRHGKHHFKQPELNRALGDAIFDRQERECRKGLPDSQRWTVNLKSYDLNAAGVLLDDELVVGLLLEPGVQLGLHRGKLPREVTSRGLLESTSNHGGATLRPSTCNLMLDLLGPITPGAVVLDTMCGVGTLPIEAAALLAPGGVFAMGGELAANASQQAGANARHAETVGARLGLRKLGCGVRPPPLPHPHPHLLLESATPYMHDDLDMRSPISSASVERLIGIGWPMDHAKALVAKPADAPYETEVGRCAKRDERDEIEAREEKDEGSASAGRGRVGRSTAKLPFAVGICRWDATLLPLRDNSIDIIIVDMPFGLRCKTSLKLHILVPRLLQEIARVLTPGGRAMLLSFCHTRFAEWIDMGNRLTSRAIRLRSKQDDSEEFREKMRMLNKICRSQKSEPQRRQRKRELEILESEKDSGGGEKNDNNTNNANKNEEKEKMRRAKLTQSVHKFLTKHCSGATQEQLNGRENAGDWVKDFEGSGKEMWAELSAVRLKIAAAKKPTASGKDYKMKWKFGGLDGGAGDEAMLCTGGLQLVKRWDVDLSGLLAGLFLLRKLKAGEQYIQATEITR